MVEYAERGDFSSPTVCGFIEKFLMHLDLSRYGTMVLGCTHFIYFRDCLEKILPGTVEIIDGNAGTVRQLKNVLAHDLLLNDK